jgi:hypothetical protein
LTTTAGLGRSHAYAGAQALPTAPKPATTAENGAPLVDSVQRLGKSLAVTSGDAGVNDPVVRGVLDEERVE